MTENEIGTQIVRAAIKVHRELGPGLLESVYDAALAHELESMALHVKAQLPVPVTYKSIHFDIGFRMDLLVNDAVVIELKSVEHLLPVHRKQIQTYLRPSNKRLGYLLNFGSALMKEGIVRAVNGLPESFCSEKLGEQDCVSITYYSNFTTGRSAPPRNVQV